MPDSLLKYYQLEQFNPVPINLDSPQAWLNHVRKRRNLYERHLGVPLYLLKDRPVLEFGCNSGENPLVMAAFGARVTLVEPNHQVHPGLRENFRRFGLESQLTDLVPQMMDRFNSMERYDLVIAEGFLNTLDHREEMIAHMVGFLTPQGRVVISWDDRYGSFLELMRQWLLRRTCRLAGVTDIHSAESLRLAQALFADDFGRLNASRPFAAWWKDSLVNPFVAAHYLWSFPEVLPLVENAGAEITGQSPLWYDGDRFSWYKDVAEGPTRHQKMLECWSRSLPFFLTGRNPSVARWPMADSRVFKAITDFTQVMCEQMDRPKGDTKPLIYPQVVEDYLLLTGDPFVVQFSLDLKNIFGPTEIQQSADLIKLYHQTRLVRNLWGCPCPYLSFRKMEKEGLLAG